MWEGTWIPWGGGWGEECFTTGRNTVYSTNLRKGYSGCFWQLAKHKPLPALVMSYAISKGRGDRLLTWTRTFGHISRSHSVTCSLRQRLNLSHLNRSLKNPRGHLRCQSHSQVLGISCEPHVLVLGFSWHLFVLCVLHKALFSPKWLQPPRVGLEYFWNHFQSTDHRPGIWQQYTSQSLPKDLRISSQCWADPSKMCRRHQIYPQEIPFWRTRCSFRSTRPCCLQHAVLQPGFPRHSFCWVIHLSKWADIIQRRFPILVVSLIKVISTTHKWL